MELTVSYPVNEVFELYAGPVLQFSITNVNETTDNFMLSRSAGQLQNLLASADAKVSNLAFNAGIIMNIKPVRKEYYKYPSIKAIKPPKTRKTAGKFQRENG